jgi:hypothetical protein
MQGGFGIAFDAAADGTQSSGARTLLRRLSLSLFPPPAFRLQDGRGEAAGTRLAERPYCQP